MLREESFWRVMQQILLLYILYESIPNSLGTYHAMRYCALVLWFTTSENKQPEEPTCLPRFGTPPRR